MGEGIGMVGIWVSSNRGSIGHSRMGEGIGMVGIWVSSNSVVEGGWVVSVVSGVQHSGFGLFFFGITLYHLLLFSITLPVSVSVRVSSPSVVSTPSSAIVSSPSIVSGMAVVSVVPRSGFSIGLCIRGSFGLGISQSNKQKYRQEFHFCWFCPRFRLVWNCYRGPNFGPFYIGTLTYTTIT